MCKGFLDGAVGDLVEHHPPHLGSVDLGRLDEVPRDGLSLAVRVGCEIDGRGGFRGVGNLLDDLPLVRHHPILGHEAQVVDPHAHFPLGNVANVAHRGFGVILAAEKAPDRAGLGGGFYDYQVFAHSYTVYIVQKGLRQQNRQVSDLPTLGIMHTERIRFATAFQPNPTATVKLGRSSSRPPVARDPATPSLPEGCSRRRWSSRNRG